MKSFGVYYWYVKMPWRGCVEHGLEYIEFYLQKFIANLTVCSGPQRVWDGSLEAPAFVKLAYYEAITWKAIFTILDIGFIHGHINGRSWTNC